MSMNRKEVDQTTGYATLAATALPAPGAAFDPSTVLWRRRRMGVKRRGSAAVLAICLALLSPFAAAQSDDKVFLDYPMDAEDKLAQQLNNPLANLITVPIQNNFDYGGGPNDDGFRYSLVAQPVIPFELSKDWNLITRTVIPYAYVSNVFPSTESGVGDIVTSMWLSPSQPTSGGLIWGVGPAILLPTASNDRLGNEQWGGGPTAVAVLVRGPWTGLVLGNYIWGMGSAPADRDKVNAGFLQLALAYTAPTRTTMFVSTESIYNGNNKQWTVPLQLGVNQLLRVGGRPLQLGGLLRYYAQAPQGGPNWGFQIRMTLIFPK